MNSSGDAAEQVVRLSLEGFEVVAKVSGEAAKSIAVLLISALKQEQKTKGKARLTNMIKSGKELKVYTVQQKDLKEFTKHAKKYGVLYTVLRDKNNKDKNAFVDIIARADDASKIQRIIDRFDLATVDKGTIVSQSEKAIEERKKKAEEKTDKSENTELFDEIFAENSSEKSADESEHKPI
ncbi:MAG: PcfB family protein, partial [Eubacterium sp.]